MVDSFISGKCVLISLGSIWINATGIASPSLKNIKSSEFRTRTSAQHELIPMWGSRSVGTSAAASTPCPAVLCELRKEMRERRVQALHGECWCVHATVAYLDFPVWKQAATEFEDGDGMDSRWVSHIEPQNDRRSMLQTTRHWCVLVSMFYDISAIFCTCFGRNQWIFLCSGLGEELDFRPGQCFTWWVPDFDAIPNMSGFGLKRPCLEMPRKQ